ncbi:unnamed protein product [Chrysoparadoxa australica]
MQSAPGFSTLYGQQQGMTKQPPQQDGGYVMKASSPSQSTALKMLVRDRMAGRLIGRGGSVLQDIQSRSGATLRVSSCGTYFPGTNERVVLVTGDHNQVKEACRLILTALHRGREKVAPSSTEAWNVPARESEITARLLINASSAGLIIGRNGCNLNSMSELSGAQFNLSQRELSVLVGERIVMIKSTLQNVITALDLLQDKLLEGAPPQRYDNMSTNYGNRAVTLGIPSLDGYHPASSRHRGPLDLPPTYRHSGSSTHHHSPIPGGVLGPVSPHAGDSSAGHHHHVDVIGHPGHGPPQEGDPTLVMPQQHHRHETNHAHHSRHPAGVNCEQPLSTIMVAISDRSAGVILGRAGATLSELQARSKARITVSQRGVHHVSNRIVTIQGYLEATQTALHLINLMVSQSVCQSVSRIIFFNSHVCYRPMTCSSRSTFPHHGTSSCSMPSSALALPPNTLYICPETCIRGLVTL